MILDTTHTYIEGTYIHTYMPLSTFQIYFFPLSFQSPQKDVVMDENKSDATFVTPFALPPGV